jgi:glycosyltransferase involved in cell wall biosynthesis
MIVALDSTPLTEGIGGISRYTAELSRALAETFAEDSFLLLSDQAVAPLAGPANLVMAPQPDSWLTRRWWSLGLPAALGRARASVFHGTDFSVPYVPVCPTVLTLHDLSPWRDIRWHAGASRVRARTPKLLRLGLATVVLTPSETIRAEAIDFFALSPSRVFAVPHAAAAHFRPIAGPPPTIPYFLFVGTQEPRKNLPMLVEAWREVRREFAVDLVLAGRRREDGPTFAPQDGLRLLGPVAEGDLPGLYAGALACCYPSHYEGFGLPVLEAMQCGCAVIASRHPAIAEVAGSAALLLSPDDPHSWVTALRAAARAPDWLQAVRQRSLARAREFSWTRTARLTREVYLEAQNRFGI